MSDARNLGPLTLGLSLGGVLLAVAVSMMGNYWERDLTMHGFGVFAAAQVAAIGLGIMARDRLAKTAALIAGVLLVGSLAFLA